MNSLIINNKEFKKYNDTYYISSDGEVYSTYSKKIIKPLLRGQKHKQYYYVDIYIDGKQKHMPIHKLVYQLWVGPINKDEQINHIDDNCLNNDYRNLYCGTQKQNISDCITNNHRIGNVFYLTVFDKEINKVITFCPAKNFIEYSGHTNKSGSLNKFFNKNWFKKRYDIIEFKKINNVSELESVTTKDDECNPVE